jgi:uncharacterized protein (TIGR02231 family)
MTLSTATPSLVGRAPVLTPLAITLAPLAQTKMVVQTSDEYGNQRDLIVERRNKAQQGRGGNVQMLLNSSSGNFNGNNDNQQQSAQREVNNGITMQNMRQQYEQADMDLNDIAGELQILDLVAKGKIQKKALDKSKQDESVSVTYDLAGRTSLPSRSSEQLIQIASLPMKGKFYKVATPLLTNYVYDEAALTNEGSTVLLAGPVSTFIAKQFVGRGDIPTVAVGESFTVGFGIDASLRAERELLEKSEVMQGGNRVLSFSYRLQVENFGGEKVDVRIIDRLPTAKENEIRVIPAQMSLELSKDPLYEKTEHKKGFMRWDASVPAQAIGTNAFAVQYQFTLEYDKQMGISGMPPPAAKK